MFITKFIKGYTEYFQFSTPDTPRNSVVEAMLSEIRQRGSRPEMTDSELRNELSEWVKYRNLSDDSNPVRNVVEYHIDCGTGW